MRILLVEDDKILGDGVRAHFERDSHAVDWFTQIEDADLALATTEFNVILLDLGLPDGSGFDLLRALRKRGDKTPVIIATAMDGISDRIEGLNIGADDYVVKPFDLEELSARMNAVSRRSANMAAPDYEVGEVKLDLATRSAERDGASVKLTAREWVVLELLVTRAGAIVSKEDLESRMYQFGAEIDSNSIEVFVSRIRRKLGRELIATERGLGYSLVKP